MININNKSTSEIYCNKIPILKVYCGSNLVWERFSEYLSCFANGFWKDEYPWTDEYCWSDDLLNTQIYEK